MATKGKIKSKAKAGPAAKAQRAKGRSGTIVGARPATAAARKAALSKMKKRGQVGRGTGISSATGGNG